MCYLLQVSEEGPQWSLGGWDTFHFMTFNLYFMLIVSLVFDRFPDFDVYLTESLLPVLAQVRSYGDESPWSIEVFDKVFYILAQAIDALGRQVSRMHQQGDKLDARVRPKLMTCGLGHRSKYSNRNNN